MNWAYFFGAIWLAAVFLAVVIAYDMKLEKRLDERLKLRDTVTSTKKRHLKIVRK